MEESLGGSTGCCHCCGSGHYCCEVSIFGLGISSCCLWGQEKKKKRERESKIKYVCAIVFHPHKTYFETIFGGRISRDCFWMIESWTIVFCYFILFISNAKIMCSTRTLLRDKLCKIKCVIFKMNFSIKNQYPNIYMSV